MIELELPGQAGRWEVRRGSYRWEGRPHELVVLSDLTRALRQEERLAWLRLIRVLSHEINNSLAPIQSIAASLQDTLGTWRGRSETTRDTGLGSETDRDLAEGLSVIETRSEALAPLLQRLRPARAAAAPAARAARRGQLGAARGFSRDAHGVSRSQGGPEVDAPGGRRSDGGDARQPGAQRRRRRARDQGRRARALEHERTAGSLCWSRTTARASPTRATCSCRSSPPSPKAAASGSHSVRQIAEAHGGSVTLANRSGRPRLRGDGAVAAHGAAGVSPKNRASPVRRRVTAKTCGPGP